MKNVSLTLIMLLLQVITVVRVASADLVGKSIQILFEKILMITLVLTDNTLVHLFVETLKLIRVKNVTIPNLIAQVLVNVKKAGKSILPLTD
jgi:hypothetical protein